MQPRDLEQYNPTDEMLKYKKNLGIGVVTVYEIEGKSYFIMGDYHNKGALTPTVGGKYDESIYTTIESAFQRKRFGEMKFSDGQVDAKHCYYSVNDKQNQARLTFLHKVKVDCSLEEFNEKFIRPMHQEATHQGAVSNFFWRLDETVNPKRQMSKSKFRSVEECQKAANNALEQITKSKFGVSDAIKEKLKNYSIEEKFWDEKELLPIKFYEDNKGRKYSELAGCYLISLEYILSQMQSPKIMTDPHDTGKQTIYITHQKFFIFEDEVRVLMKILQELTPQKNSSDPRIFQPSTVQKEIELQSPWVAEKISFEKLNHVAKPAVLSVAR